MSKDVERASDAGYRQDDPQPDDKPLVIQHPAGECGHRVAVGLPRRVHGGRL
jgi:hypothetical protein